MKKEAEKFADSSVMEGMVSIRAVLEGGMSGKNDRKILRVLFDVAKAESKARDIAFLQNRGKALGFPVTETTSEEIDGMTVGSSHGGIVALCSDRTLPPLTEDGADGDFFVMLDGIEDPYNFGYCLRSLYAAGASGVIVPPRSWMSAAGLVCRASAGASELFGIYVSEAVEAARIMKSKGFSVIAADKSQGAVSIYDTEITRPLLLLVGGEKRGIDAAAKKLADKTVVLDYGRRFPAALSAASAASVIAFEIFRRGRSK